MRVAILVFPFASPSIFTFARKLAAAVASVATYTALVSGRMPTDLDWPNDVQVRDIGVRLHYLKEKRPTWFSAMVWIGKVFWVQTCLAKQVFGLRHEIDVVICSLGCYYQLPILMARVVGKKVICTSLGLDSFSASLSYGSTVATFTSFLVRFNFALSHAVLVESLRLGVYKDVVRFRSKLHNGALFLQDLDRFAARTSVLERKNLVGFIGRLVAAKGVMEFVHAIPFALEQRPDLEFLIIGTGTLDEALEKTIEGKPWASRVTWLKWVEHEHIPDYLNRLKLTVIPSYSEGLPNLVLEAMGCGTPVLASSVGGIPDLVIDGETGFLLDDNSPTAIAQAIVRVVDDPRLEIVVQQARALIERDYSLDAVSKRYRAMMEKLSRVEE